MASIVAATLALACVAPAAAETSTAEVGPTRAEYVAQVEPICKANTIASKRILKGARGRIKHGKLARAGRQLLHAARDFGRTVREIVAVPMPARDEARLLKWFKFLRIVKKNLTKVGKALKHGDKIKAVHEETRTERSANAANNVSFVFGFHYCKLTPSRFR